jgi:hypothetical protein
MRMRAIVVLLLAVVSALVFPLESSADPAETQATTSPQAAAADAAPTLQDQAIRLYIQCNGAPCDQDFFRTEINWVNHVRDRQDADVHILITGQGTGGGGSQYTFQFMGLRNFEGRDAELFHNTQPNQAQDATRRGILRVIQLGLVPYVLGTPLAEELQVTRRAQTGSAVRPPTTTDVHDPWNFWVYRMRIGGNFNGETTSTNASVNGSVSANRTTEDWKFNLASNGNYQDRTFTLSSGSKFSTISRNSNANGSVTRSLTPHWSSVVRGRVASDTFVNQDIVFSLSPGIEWNFFPYSEWNNRQLTFQYLVGYNRFAYYQITLYDKLKETLVDEEVNVALDLAQPWGSAGMTFQFANYFHDTSKYHIRLNGEADFRLVRGLSINFFGNVSRVHDQLYLQRGDATDEEILVRQRQLATSYRYGFSFGVSYTFGSIFNNVVNPRFRDN